MTQFKGFAGISEPQLRLLFSFLLAQDSAGIATDGVLTGLGVAQTTTASASVVVGSGAAVAQDSLLNGVSPLVLDTALTLDVLGANPMGGVPRNDLVVFDAATLSSGTGGVRVVVGTPNAVPTDPAVPATAAVLARLRHAASATTVPAAKIDDLRAFTHLFGVPTMQTGTVTLAGDGTNQRTQAVTFPVAFPGTPIIMLQPLTGMSTSATTQNAWPSSESATGFTCNLTRNNTTTVTVRWTAYYQA